VFFPAAVVKVGNQTLHGETPFSQPIITGLGSNIPKKPSQSAHLRVQFIEFHEKRQFLALHFQQRRIETHVPTAPVHHVTGQWDGATAALTQLIERLRSVDHMGIRGQQRAHAQNRVERTTSAQRVALFPVITRTWPVARATVTIACRVKASSKS
jgi:hypothetical protein